MSSFDLFDFSDTQIVQHESSPDEIRAFVDSLHEQWGGAPSSAIAEMFFMEGGELLTIDFQEDNDRHSLYEAPAQSVSLLAKIAATPGAVQFLTVAGMLVFTIGNAFWQGFKKSDTYAIIDKWKENTLGNIIGRVSWKPSERAIVIKGIRYDKLLKRVEEMYNEKGFGKIFGRSYKFFKQLTYDMKLKKKLQIEDINGLRFHHFFALEIAKIFEELAARYDYSYYEALTAQLWRKTWLKEFVEEPTGTPLDLAPLSAIRYTLKDYQRDFIAQYPLLKRRLNMRGVVLAFDQGLGKTLTAVGLAECLKKKRVYIVCPNSLRQNWQKELEQYFLKYVDPSVARREIYVHGVPNQEYSKAQTRFVIVNNEAIEKVHFTIGDVSGADSMLIIDEGHNFRNFKGQRTTELLAFRAKIGCEDVLPMSGTPIKATPNEIVPVLLLIDRIFDMDAAKTYNSLFAVDDVATKNIVRERFGKIIYRKRKAEVLDLPKKNERTLSFMVDNQDRFLLENVNPLVNQRFLEIYAEKLKSLGPQRDRYADYVIRFSSSSQLEKDKYLRWVRQYASYGQRSDWHELTVNDMEEYANRYVLPNVPDAQKNDFKTIHAQVLLTRRSAMGEAIGEIIPKMRRDLYLALWEENKADIIKRIQENPHKTVIFTIFLDVAKKIHADLKDTAGSVLIVGETKDRFPQIERFKNDDEIDALVATSQTLATGVTLVEANQMFFFGTPWRSSDYDQASDRIHRIGQKNEVFIYNVILGTTRPNLSTRMQEILSWSDKMFGSLVNNEDDASRLFSSGQV